MVNFTTKPFHKLTTSELYDLLQLRSEIFVVEQNCVYQDIDGKDKKALHVLGYKKNKLVAYTRIFRPGDYFTEASLGRVAVLKQERSFGYGHEILKEAVQKIQSEFNTLVIKISAQTYLKFFYESHGFKKIGSEYLEDGIPHIAMIKT